MIKAKIDLDRNSRIGEIDPRIFGAFVEHLGRCVYTGIYEPGHPKADKDGFRRDVLELVRELGTTVMRYPGGNFVSGYNWEDGVGPKNKRPKRLELAWFSTETNRFGTDEFAAWCRKADVEPMLAVNLGTRGPDDARRLLEYCNYPGGTALSDLRKKHGWQKPHNIKMWCLGNEAYGDWQMGHKTAYEYGRTAHEAGKMMKWVDPSVELVLCGADQTWNAQVLELAYPHSDYFSIHFYYDNPDADTASYLARADEMSEAIEATIATCDNIAAKLKQNRKMSIAVDEWNAWNMSGTGSMPEKRWTEFPPLLEQVYNQEDALLVGSMLISIINHADRVKIANIAQLVNVIGPIMTRPKGPAWRQTIFYPFAQAAKFCRGAVLHQKVTSDKYDCRLRTGVPCLASASILTPEKGLVVLAVNRSLKEEMELTVGLSGTGSRFNPVDWTVLQHPDLKAVNTAEKQNVKPVPASGAVIKDNSMSAVLKPASWNVFRIK